MYIFKLGRCFCSPLQLAALPDLCLGGLKLKQAWSLPQLPKCYRGTNYFNLAASRGGSKCHIPFSFPGNSSASCAHLSLKSSATEVCVNPTESCINLFPSPSCVLGVFSWVTIPKITPREPCDPPGPPEALQAQRLGLCGRPKAARGNCPPGK